MSSSSSPHRLNAPRASASVAIVRHRSVCFWCAHSPNCVCASFSLSLSCFARCSLSVRGRSRGGSAAHIRLPRRARHPLGSVRLALSSCKHTSTTLLTQERRRKDDYIHTRRYTRAAASVYKTRLLDIYILFSIVLRNFFFFIYSLANFRE